MTGEEAERMFNQLENIRSYLQNQDDKRAFYYLGRLAQELADIVEQDRVSFNPTGDEHDEGDE